MGGDIGDDDKEKSDDDEEQDNNINLIFSYFIDKFLYFDCYNLRKINSHIIKYGRISFITYFPSAFNM